MGANSQKLIGKLVEQMRGSLQSLAGYTELMLDSKQGVSDRLNCLGGIGQSVKWLQKDLEMMAELAHLTAPATTAAPFSLLPLLAEVQAQVAPEAWRRQLRFELSSLCPLPETIQIEPTRFKRTLSSLLGALLSGAERGGVLIAISYSSAGLVFSARATGIAQTSAAAWQESNAGMLLAAEGAKGLGGTLQLVQSGAGQGTTWELVVPVTVPENTPFLRAFSSDQLRSGTQDDGLAAKLAAQFAGRRVLICEDAPDIRHLLSRILTKAGAAVETAENGIDAVRKAVNSAFDLVLMDIQMPALDGFAATKEIRTAGRTAPVVALTANSDEAFRNKCLASGFAGFLTKPIYLVSLVDLMKRFTNEAAPIKAE